MNNRIEMNKGLLEFIEESATSFHAVAAAAKRLEAAGFQRLDEGCSWQETNSHLQREGNACQQEFSALQKNDSICSQNCSAAEEKSLTGAVLTKGGKYYVIRNNSSLIAFTVPQNGLAPFKITAAHSDSPCLKIKENSELLAAGKYSKLNVEVYGGAIYYSWFDRPLSIAGRVLLDTEKGIKEQLIDFKKDVVMVPSMPIHLNREINKGFEINPQVDLLPLFAMKNMEVFAEERPQEQLKATEEWGCKAADNDTDNDTDDANNNADNNKATLKSMLAEELGVNSEEILGHDLFIYNNAKGTVWGANSEFISAPRLDDLACGYACLLGIMAAENEDAVNVFALFDNEEEGSLTKQGADSTFLSDVLRRISLGLGASEEDFYCLLARSFMVSADNAHGVHPNHPEKYDENNRCFLNGGPVIKFNAGQKYTTDAVSSAYFKKLCNSAEVPYQVFANRSDMAGGSTLGRLSAGHVSVNMVDIGLPQLAMHSSYETMGAFDLEYMVKALYRFYSQNLTVE